jgi:hypothetical protein
VDPIEYWGDGSLRKAELSFRCTVTAGGSRSFSLHSEARPALEIGNPLVLTMQGVTAEVKQGPVLYQISRRHFALVDQTLFGTRPFHRAGGRGAVLVLKDGRVLSPEGEVQIQAETRGPLTARLRVEGEYGQGFRFRTFLTFVSGKSWFQAVHQVTEGDLEAVEAVLFDFRLNLADHPVTTNFGAGEGWNGVPISWIVVTDQKSTIDVAALDMWSGSRFGDLRIEPDGRFTTRFPQVDRPCRLFVHYLLGPPDDLKNTPAVAMASPLDCRGSGDSP